MAKFTYGDVLLMVHTFGSVLPLEVNELLEELIEKRQEAVDWEDATETAAEPAPDPRNK